MLASLYLYHPSTWALYVDTLGAQLFEFYLSFGDCTQVQFCEEGGYQVRPLPAAAHSPATATTRRGTPTEAKGCCRSKIAREPTKIAFMLSLAPSACPQNPLHDSLTASAERLAALRGHL